MRAIWRHGLRVATLAAPFLLLVNAGCEKSPPASQPPAPAPAKSAATQPSDTEMEALRNFVANNNPQQEASPELPPGHPAIDQAMPPGHPAVTNSQLAYDVPADWERQQPASSMRKAQFLIPSQDGGDPGELVVFYFGPQGAGGLEANLDRWRKQFSQPDGQEVPDEKVTREEFDVNDLHVTYLDVTGTYNAGAMQMGQSQGPKTEYRLLSAIVETPQGPWYFKATGPEKTMAQHKDEFLAFLKTMKYE